MSRISRELHRSLVHARAKPVDANFSRYKIFVQYLGHMFNGSSGKTQGAAAAAATKGGRRGRAAGPGRAPLSTVEDCLINAARLFVGDKGEYRNLSISSRTDAGVHAYRNCFQVDLPNKSARLAAEGSSSSGDGAYDASQVCRGFNYFLRASDPFPGLVATDARRVEGGEPFDARASSTGRTYVYRLLVPSAGTGGGGSGNHFGANLFADSFSWSLPCRLDVVKMQECARLLVGEKDFSAFRGAGCQSKSPYRLVTQLEVRSVSAIEQAGGSGAFVGSSGVTSNVFVGDKDLFFLGDNDLVVITITANAFLLKMVRNIVGALVAVGGGRLAVGDVALALESKDRLALKCEPAPARGLFLHSVHYADEEQGGGTENSD